MLYTGCIISLHTLYNIVVLTFQFKNRSDILKYNNIQYRVKNYAFLEGGFTQVSNSVLKIVDNAYQFTVYFYLCKNWNKRYNYAFPSIRTISKDCKMSVPTVQKAIKGLEEKRLVAVLKFDEKLYNSFPNNIYRRRRVLWQK